MACLFPSDQAVTLITSPPKALGGKEDALSWGVQDPELQAYVLERQRITIQNYANDPDLLAEHVGMEDNFQAGGYGERQVEELLQNAIDQLVSPGRVEFRIADGALYCANEGAPFGVDGIRAITGAFLSAKKDEKIGRFGLGFKSVLGVTDRPQIISRSVSFGFNSPEAQALLADLPYQPARVPTLRVPSLLDAAKIAREDANVEEMMEWASTIIRLPLVRGGARLFERLRTFDVRYLLFPDFLAGVDIVLQGQRRSFRRRPAADKDLVSLEAPGEAPSMYRVLHREHGITAAVGETLPGLFHRERVRVSYALPVGQGRRADGEFWAWFPLLDRTTAQGIFNAPWQVNDDRTSMLPGSALNKELLEVAAELLIDAALLESTPADPAKHLDVLPARGRETRSNADRYMSDMVPRLARRHELIPTAKGVMRAPARVRTPRVRNASGDWSLVLPPEVIRRWSEVTDSTDTPHWSCYTTATRAARLTQLLTDEDENFVSKTIYPVAWLSEAALPRTIDSIDAALSIYLLLKDDKRQVWDQFAGALILPLADGTFAKASDTSTVLLSVEHADVPERVRLIAPEFAADEEIREKLRRIGVKEVSRDQIAFATAAMARSTWCDEDWRRLWESLALASPATGQAALAAIRDRNIRVLIPTKAGGWRDAGEVFEDPMSVPGVPARQPDLSRIGGRSDLLAAAGCLKDLSKDYPVHEGQAFTEYRARMQRVADRRVTSEYGVKGKLKFADRRGIGPLDILLELSESEDQAAPKALARWTTRVVELLPEPKSSAVVEFGGTAKNKTAELKSIEIWSLERYGVFNSTLGPARVTTVVGRKLEAYGQLIPVVVGLVAGVYELPSDLDGIPRAALEILMAREGYEIDDPERLAELLGVAASRDEFSSRDAIPALDPITRRVHLTHPSAVVLASEEELDDLGSHNLRFIPSGKWDDALTSAWSVLRAADLIERVVDWASSSDAVPLLDVYPTLGDSVDESLDDVLLQRCSSVVRRTTSPSGVREQRLSGHLDGRTVLVDDELDQVDTLLEVGRILRLRLTRADADTIIMRDDKRRKTRLVQDVQAEESETGKLLKLVGREKLAVNLPEGLLEIVEERQGRQSNCEVAQLFLATYGTDALRRLKDPIAARGLVVPRAWDGTPEAEEFVTNLGFARAYAGTREKKNPPIEVVPGKVKLKPLHDFQEALLAQIRELALVREGNGDHRRGLLYLPTGAGKTRVTTESIARMLRDDELGSPILWIAQSEELCEQAIVSWTEVWRAKGDERPLEITRYWGGYEADESFQELQVVVATDAKLVKMITNPANRQAHNWLQKARMVVIDEAHRAGSSSYVDILRWLGITQGAGAHTDRPLLGLTATPYRGTNEEVNRHFAARFGQRRLNALDEDDPIGQLRDMRVLSTVEHQLLDGVVIDDAPTEGRGGSKAWDDVSRIILDKLGSNHDRTQLLVDHVMRQDADWPILVFTPSVVSAHVTAALIRSLGRPADAVDGGMRGQERRRKIDAFKSARTKVLVNCDLLTQGFDAPKVRALYIARPTFSPNRYVQMVGRGLRGALNGGTDDCLVVNVVDTFTQFDRDLAYTEFDYLWTKQGAGR